MSIANNEMTIDLNNIDKSNWKIYRFDEIAKNISERVDPNNTDLTVYIGLEHLDSGSIHIKRHGKPEDVKGQKLKFYKGDVIFGRRRAYQRKAGVATSDGFCSAHALVLRANPDVIIPDLFAFFLHSDLFMNRAIDISVGSLSPTINWGTLKHQEFLIPSLEEQGEIEELLILKEENIQKKLMLLNKLNSLLLVSESSMFSKNSKNEVKLKKLILKTLSGGTPDTKNSSFYDCGEIPWITTKILEGDFIGVGEKYITEEAIKKSAAKVLAEKNIVAGTRVGVGKFSVNEIELSFSQDITGLEINKDYANIEYLVYQLNSKPFQRKLHPLCRGTTIKGVTKDDLLNLSVALPEKDKQIILARKVRAIKLSIAQVKSSIEEAKILQKTVISQVF